MLVELFVAVVLTTSAHCVKTQKGKNFLLPFLNTTGSARLMFITDKPTNIHIEPSTQGPPVLSLEANEVHNVYVSVNDVGYTGSASLSSQHKAVTITASEDVWLYVFLTDAAGYNDTGGFMAVPTDVLTATYTAVTYKRNDVSPYNNFILVAAVEDNTTVAMNVKHGSMCVSANVSDGDIVLIALNRSDVIGLLCRDDITGTVIQSDKKVAVVTGHECAMVPGAANKCNLLVEMMIPVESFGETFVLSAPNITGGVVYRIVASHDSTLISDSSGVISTLNEGDFVDVDLNTTSNERCIETSEPCIVVVINKCAYPSSNNNDINKGSGMSIVPSTDRYLDNYIINFVDAFDETNIISVVYNKPTTTNVTNASRCDFEMMTLKVDEWSQMDYINSSGLKGVILYRQSEDKMDMASFPLGMIFDKDECVSIPCYNNATCDDLIYDFTCICQPGFNGTLCEIDIDECLSSPCQNNATCHDNVNRFDCECHMGFNGTLCETDIDECASSPCQNNATCRDDVNRFICDCQMGFNGSVCEKDIDECASSPCQNNATCRDDVNGFICDCQMGFNGDVCEEDIDECLSSPCQNNATCHDNVNRFDCECHMGFNGTLCETDIDECASSPCQNNATCRDDVNGFICDCQMGFNGSVCEEDIDECASSPCQNNATCRDDVNAFICDCQMGFNGDVCEEDIDECLSSPCQNNATCHDNVNRFDCECHMGFNGTLCETDIDECASSPCRNNATCRDDINGFICDCQLGFNGSVCEEDIDEFECASSPCQNNATCRNDINGFICDCQVGFKGDVCEEDIDECLSGPCGNNATCFDMVNGFECLCSQGFSGGHCETDIDECLTTTCENGGTCEDLPGYFLCHCKPDFHGVTCEHNGYSYVFTRLLDVDDTLMTSSGVTVVATPLATNIRFKTTYTTPLAMYSTPGADSEIDCVCTRYGNDIQPEVDPEVLTDKIKNDLLLDTSNLTKTVNRYLSSEDDRPSAKGLGSVGCMIIIFSIMLIVVPDVLYVLRKLDGNRGTRPEKKA